MNDKSRSEYMTKYKKQNYKRVPLEMSLSDYDRLKNAASAADEPINRFIKNAINDRIDQISQIDNADSM